MMKSLFEFGKIDIFSLKAVFYGYLKLEMMFFQAEVAGVLSKATRICHFVIFCHYFRLKTSFDLN